MSVRSVVDQPSNQLIKDGSNILESSSWHDRFVTLQNSAENPETIELLRMIVQCLKTNVESNGLKDSELSLLIDRIEQLTLIDDSEEEHASKEEEYINVADSNPDKTIKEVKTTCKHHSKHKHVHKKENEGCKHSKHKHEHKSLEKKLKHIVHKTAKGIRHHKKEILIGAALAIAVGTVVIISGGSAAPAIAAAGGAAAGGTRYDRAMQRRRKESNGSTPTGSTKKASEEETRYDRAVHRMNPTPAESSNPVTFNRNFITRVFDKERVLREHGLKEAETKAREQRYPGLVHPVEDIHGIKSKAVQAFDKFKSDLIKDVNGEDLKNVIELAVGIVGLSKGDNGTRAGIIVAATAAALSAKYGENIAKAYKPLGEIYAELHAKDKINRDASFARCEKEGYEPNLEFHPKGSTDPFTSILTDKNNPNPNEIYVVMP